MEIGHVVGRYYAACAVGAPAVEHGRIDGLVDVGCASRTDVIISIYGCVDPVGAPPAGIKVSIGQPIGAVGTLHTNEGELCTSSFILLMG